VDIIELVPVGIAENAGCAASAAPASTFSADRRLVPLRYSLSESCAPARRHLLANMNAICRGRQFRIFDGRCWLPEDAQRFDRGATPPVIITSRTRRVVMIEYTSNVCEFRIIHGRI
jgi:hypothetical protein